MPVEIFTRSEFEKALSFLPLSAKCIGAKSGQLEYLAPIVNNFHCTACGLDFYPNLCDDRGVQCPKCGLCSTASEKAILSGEIYIKIYSSIDPLSGESRDTGEDSIRLVLVGYAKKPLGTIGYTTRVKGWEDRLRAKCRTLWEEAQSFKRCPKCKHHVGWCTCGNGPNKGRQFAKCYGCDQWIGWKE